MAVSSVQVTVGTTATSLYADAGDTFGAHVTLKNAGAAAIFVGPAGVTTANGFLVAVNEVVRVECGAGESLFGIVAAATQPMHVLVTKN